MPRNILMSAFMLLSLSACIDGPLTPKETDQRSDGSGGAKISPPAYSTQTNTSMNTYPGNNVAPNPVPVVPQETCIGATPDICEAEQIVVDGVNQYRPGTPLTQDFAWSVEQGEDGYISHAGFPSARIKAYMNLFSNMKPEMSFSAENVAFTYAATAQEAARALVSMWYRSSGHRKNMLNTSYKFIGIGIAPVGNSKRYYGTQIFGSQNNGSYYYP